MIPSWFWLAAGAGIIGNGFNFVNRFSLRGQQDSTAYAWWFEFLRLVVFGTLAMFNFQLAVSSKSLSMLVSLGLVELVAIYLYMKMHAFTELSLSAIIVRLRQVWVLLVAWVLIGERLNFTGYLGILIIFTGLALALWQKNFKPGKGLKLALAFSIVSAVMWALMKGGAEFVSTPVLIMFLSWPSVVFLPLVMKNPAGRIVALWRQKVKNLLLSVGSDAVTLYLMAQALRQGPVSKVLSVSQGMLVLAILAGILFLGEKERAWQKLLGGLITVGGVWLLV
ncbi:MAG: hypothetical protein UX85_C0001G0260 [Candidatus Beckwithbacteria bacterium GW2011_GWB1_47_15]|uniref:EamA domain-containing protein n=1 Tax=Candidatus Beckwithbacteria bacterium GW2011_GWB1_47_15 TaxID=1618371 RepID=A0A0G1RY67_9BACT|nr:MAG: hypothetical protein UY43_C0001G0865 [Candidatus Beckwithbacteria bacterium GW2011_GWC1_49_16]AQS30898.1 hypothetical protein [uncultured bacterium]KKU36082.1 MAG: hypothetical protein UX50_C0001G0259 [Candidatus Beckwithbacteria bacterium GW2011_GWA1_46_30]KKU62046.1 MAG: hypothetical protein UX85_C0001G0260 [Candidatus Beckwithbacteria bacterium GW2011_GWB1_47_15]KKU72401.1 MAG: hypothetical protein UX97_C0001G0271 [Candidatus Beckwithbacteria bacterium GW2011_GWA2_47_25]OGD49308.1 M